MRSTILIYRETWAFVYAKKRGKIPNQIDILTLKKIKKINDKNKNKTIQNTTKDWAKLTSAITWEIPGPPEGLQDPPPDVKSQEILVGYNNCNILKPAVYAIFILISA